MYKISGPINAKLELSFLEESWVGNLEETLTLTWILSFLE